MKNNQRLVGARTYESEIQVYDGGFGPLWIYRHSLGIGGIVRAKTFENAYEVLEEEFFPEADESAEMLQRKYGFRREHVKIVMDPVNGERPAKYPDDYPDGKLALPLIRWDVIDTPDSEAWAENELFCEAYGFRPFGRGIYAVVDGESLDKLTPALQAELGITLEIEEEEI